MAKVVERMTWNVYASKEETGVLMEAGLIYRESRKFAEAREVFEGVKALLPTKRCRSGVALGTVSFHSRRF